MSDGQSKKSITRELFYFYVDRVRTGMMTYSDFRHTVFKELQEKTGLSNCAVLTHYNGVYQRHLRQHPEDVEALTSVTAKFLGRSPINGSTQESLCYNTHINNSAKEHNMSKAEPRIHWNITELRQLKEYMDTLPGDNIVEKLNLAQSALLPTARLRIIDCWSKAESVVQRMEKHFPKEVAPAVPTVQVDNVIVMTQDELQRFGKALRPGTTVQIV